MPSATIPVGATISDVKDKLRDAGVASVGALYSSSAFGKPLSETAKLEECDLFRSGTGTEVCYTML